MYKQKQQKILILIWIYLLIALSGAINVYALEVFLMPLTHHSGTLSNASIALFNDPLQAFYLIKICLCFLFGSSISGWFYHKKESLFNANHLYFVFIGSLLFFCLNLFNLSLRPYLISLWMGIQNGMYIKVYNLRVCITHVSGTFSDAGFALGAFLNGKKNEYKIFLFLISKLIFFF